MAKKKALGRGLGALIDNPVGVTKSRSLAIDEVEIQKIEANPFQPRTTFDEETLEELANSIKEMGLIQPLTLRRKTSGGYQIIAGERRFRASKKAGLTRVPAYIREIGDDQLLEMALVENIQREDLDAIEIALSYQRLIDECRLTQERLSERVGKKRATVANYLRLLKLPAEIQIAIRQRSIQMGHARALISVANPEKQRELFLLILDEGLSVRKVEELVRRLNQGETLVKGNARQPLPQEYKMLKKQLSSFFNTSVRFSRDEKGKGKITIPFKTDDELERIIGIFDKLNS